MNILIAPNAFKNSLGASEVAAAIQQGLQQSKLDCNCTCFPVGDGGDGTAELIITHLAGNSIPTAIHDPLGRKIEAPLGFVDDGKTAVIEMANASGLRLLQQPELDPLHASAYGTGEQIKIALARGVDKLIIAMGGSATIDGGVGILQALGVQFLDAAGSELKDMPKDLLKLAAINIGSLDKRVYDCEIVVLCDVTNHLLGKDGAVNVFAPQKGASSEDVVVLEAALKRFAAVTAHVTGINIAAMKHGGTAGGAAAGLYAFLHAKLVHGINYFLNLTGFDTALALAELVITGEGSIDEQTLQGKGPYGVARRAKSKGIPAIVFAGKTGIQNNSRLHEYFRLILNINEKPFDPATALKNTRQNLINVSFALGNMLAEDKSTYKKT